MRSINILLVGLAALVLAGCTASAPPEATPAPDPSDEPSPLPSEMVSAEGTRLQTIDGYTFSAEGPGDCTTNAAINTPWLGHGKTSAKLLGEITDMGATPVAGGPVGYKDDGLIESYTVVPGDTLEGIGERFCIDWVTVAVFNHRFPPPTRPIAPRDVLILRPDPTVPWSRESGDG